MQRVCAILWRHFWPFWLHHIFRHYLKKTARFSEKVIDHKICVVVFSTTPMSLETSVNHLPIHTALYPKKQGFPHHTKTAWLLLCFLWSRVNSLQISSHFFEVVFETHLLLIMALCLYGFWCFSSQPKLRQRNWNENTVLSVNTFFFFQDEATYGKTSNIYYVWLLHRPNARCESYRGGGWNI